MASLPVVAAVKFAVSLLAVALALVVWRGNPRAAPNVFLAFFLVLVAGSYAVNGLVWNLYGQAQRFFPAAWDQVARYELVFNVLDPLVLLYFASVFPERNALNRPWLFGALAAPVALLLVAAVATPGALVGDAAVLYPEGTGTTGRMPAATVLFNVYYVLLYGAAFLALARAHAVVDEARERSVRFVWIAVGIATLPRAASSALMLVNPLDQGPLALFGGLPPDPRPGRDLAPQLLDLLVVAVVLAAAMWAAARLHRGRRPAGRAAVAVAAVGGTFAAFLPLASALSATGSFQVNAAVGPVIGAWQALRWLAFLGILGYAVLEGRVFDLQRRMRTSLAFAIVGVAGVLAAGAGLAVATAWGGRESFTRAGSWFLFGLVVSAAAATGAWPFARRLADRAFPRADDPEFLRERKVEVFRAAVAEARAAGRDPLADRRLVAFRRSLGLSEEAHRALAKAPPPATSGAPPPVLPGTLLFDRYDVQRLLGSGGSGRTWLARDVVLDRDVAVKHVFGQPEDADGRMVARYVREARAAGGLRHPNVVAVLDARAAGTDYVLVMEHVAGGTLAARLAREAPLPAADVVRLLDGVLAGLEAVHAKGVLHRDVKPANVLLSPAGAPKLADFGVAHVPDLEGTRTGSGRPAHPGTPRYMAPEQALGLPLSSATDLFSAAVVAYEALTARPFADEAARRPGSDPVVPLGDVRASPQLRAVLARALARRPEARYPTARAFREALASLPEA